MIFENGTVLYRNNVILRMLEESHANQLTELWLRINKSGNMLRNLLLTRNI
jgi:hypothetical protein